HLRLRDLDAAAIADDAAVANALVLAAIALPVLDRAEDLLAEEPVLFRLERAVVDRLGLRDLAMRPAADHVRGRESDADLVELNAPARAGVVEPTDSELAEGVEGGLQVGVLNHECFPPGLSPPLHTWEPARRSAETHGISNQLISSNCTSRQRLWSSF